VPTTLVVQLEDPRAGLSSGKLRARARIFTPDEGWTVTLDGREVPVEFETTSSLASALADSPFWSFELSGFFSGATRPFKQAVTGTDVLAEQTQDEGLLFLSPYRPGHIPLVLVHGTASSPGRWADLVNELENDRAILERYQIWLFLYNTGNPIGYSGALLRRALENAVADLDPQGTDPALHRMVVAGHSQGGLLTKLTAIDSGDRFWRNLSDLPPEQLDLDPDVRDTLVRSTFFTPEPFVERVIFVCTPHRGSYLAGLRLLSLSPAKWVADLVALPSNLTTVATELVTRNQGKLKLRSMTRLPTSIDNMTPGNPFIKTLAEIPVAPGIPAHSIIAVKGDGPPEGQSDGVVAYESAHVEGVESELVVRSSHSAQGQPGTIEEIRRILLEHAAAP
jgi:pimeloyl-ACP methyl ester carboxylesterase